MPSSTSHLRTRLRRKQGRIYPQSQTLMHHNEEVHPRIPQVIQLFVGISNRSTEKITVNDILPQFVYRLQFRRVESVFRMVRRSCRFTDSEQQISFLDQRLVPANAPNLFADKRCY